MRDNHGNCEDFALHVRSFLCEKEKSVMRSILTIMHQLTIRAGVLELISRTNKTGIRGGSGNATSHLPRQRIGIFVVR